MTKSSAFCDELHVIFYTKMALILNDTKGKKRFLSRIARVMNAVIADASIKY
jgi:hypothetical protein